MPLAKGSSTGRVGGGARGGRIGPDGMSRGAGGVRRPATPPKKATRRPTRGKSV